jgi:hypothetical protein
MPKAKKMSSAEAAARARSLKGSQEMREAFGINDDYQREVVRVDSLPDPPATEVIEAAQKGRSAPVAVNLDEAVIGILKEEGEEIRVRLERFGLVFTPYMQQAMVDQVYSMLALNGQGIMVGGGAIARR